MINRKIKLTWSVALYTFLRTQDILAFMCTSRWCLSHLFKVKPIYFHSPYTGVQVLFQPPVSVIGSYS